MLSAQPYGNEWINYDQDYYKIPIVKDAFYQVTYNDLQAAGIPVGSIAPETFQLFGRGEEEPIKMYLGSNNTFDPGDFFVFYGEMNDGELDEPLFEDPSHHTAKSFSIFTDTAFYYLTWNSSALGLRYQDFGNTDFTGLTPEQSYSKEEYVDFHDRLYHGHVPQKVLYPPYMNEGEGWRSTQIQRQSGTWITHNYDAPDYLASSGSGRAEISVVSTWYTDPNPTNPPTVDQRLLVFLDGTQVVDDKFLGFDKRFHAITLDESNFADGRISLQFRGSRDDIQANNTFMALSFIRYKYTARFGFFGKSSLRIDLPSDRDRFIEMGDYPAGLSRPIILDRGNSLAPQYSLNSGTLRFKLPKALDNHDLLLGDESQLESVSISPASFRAYASEWATGVDYLIITHPNLKTSAQRYASYRSSSAGGGYNVGVAYTPEIYGQFYYGVHHSLAIKNFLRYLIAEVGKAEHVLLLGKGYMYDVVRTDKDVSLDMDLVPTIGYPPSDFLYLSQIDGNIYDPLIGIGRVPAATVQEADNYLNKVKAYESNGIAYWRKNVLHISGGQDEDEILLWKTHNLSLGKTASEPSMGANMFYISKADEQASTDLHAKEILRIANNEGLSFLSFNGHGAAQEFEVDIGEPNQYLHADKSPIMMFGGCVLGNTFIDGKSLCEDYLLSPTSAVAWIAASERSFDRNLQNYNSKFYVNAFGDLYGATLGEIFRKTIQDYQGDGTDPFLVSQLLQTNLHGDPAIRFYSPEEPDYQVLREGLFLSPDDVDANSDSFDLFFTIQNLGKAVSDSINVSIRVKYPNAVTIDSLIIVPAPKSSKEYSFRFYRNENQEFGTTAFTVEANPQTGKQKNELNYANNSASLNYLMRDIGASALFPENFSIVSSQGIELTAQSNLLSTQAQTLTYEFELDTVPSFNSPYKQGTQITSTSSITRWKINLLSADSQAYFWRVRLTGEGFEDVKWSEFSFTYINESVSGWAQVDYNQYKDVTRTGVILSDESRKMRFAFRSDTRVQMITSTDLTDPMEFRVGLGLVTGRPQNKVNNNRNRDWGFVVYALNPFDLSSFSITDDQNLWKQQYGIYVYDFNWLTVRGDPVTVNPDVVDSLASFIAQVPDSYYVCGYTARVHNMPGAGDALHEALEKIGLQLSRTVGADQSYTFVGVKGRKPGRAIREAVSLPAKIVEVTHNFALPLNEGTFKSSLIGPSRKWRDVSVRMEKDASDAFRYNLVGIRFDGSEERLESDLVAQEVDISHVDADVFPFLRIDLSFDDKVDYTPPQFANWIVHYDRLPEATLNPDLAFDFKSDTLNQGQSVSLDIGYQNISNFPLDSVLVRYEISNEARELVVQKDIRTKPLNGGDDVVLSEQFSTEQLRGFNTLRVITNPEFDQSELYEFNNTYERSFYVEVDNTKPILDVTFDGTRIINGDIISPKPQIVISSRDDNPYFLLDDTSYFEVYLKYPDARGRERVSFNDPNLIFYPAQSVKQNKARIEYSPHFKVDGSYELIVQARDGSNNGAEAAAFRVEFEVVNKTSITHFYPYPNPFSTQMRFVFTLTGEQLPDDLRIQIITVSGKVVKEIDLARFGSIKIGNNVSEFVWDGTDMFGNLLANGVYMYRVQASINGQKIDQRSTSADNLFKEGIGKIYIMR